MGTQWHTPYELLKPETQDMARALNSLQEEIEAIDWYNQRVDVTGDPELRGVIEHNRDEEKEHAAMVLEWIRRHDPVWDKCLKQYLFTSQDLLGIEHAADSKEGPGDGAPAAAARTKSELSLTVGSLRHTGSRPRS